MFESYHITAPKSILFCNYSLYIFQDIRFYFPISMAVLVILSYFPVFYCAIFLIPKPF